MSPLQTALLPLCILFRGSPSCLREAEDDEGSFKRAKKDFDESISTPFEGISIDDGPEGGRRLGGGIGTSVQKEKR
jgi:hypothetical protein